MASSKADEAPYYYPLSPDGHPKQPQTYVVLPFYLPAAVRRQQGCRVICAAILLLLAVAVYCLWPCEPDLKIVRLRLDRIHIHTFPIVSVDVTLGLIVKVRNVDLFSIDYRSLDVSIGYKGRKLGFVSSDHGHVRARGSSYVDATIDLDGVEILYDVIPLLEDLARGSVPFDTFTEIRGQIGLFFFEVPLKARESCEVYVNTRNQTIIRQNCYPE